MVLFKKAILGVSNVIKTINVRKYRKMSNISFNFSKNINIISGTNGTCKTSLLHIVSNSFQSMSKINPIIQDKDCLEVIKQINSILNPKIESLTKGDKQYNDPSNGLSGTLFSVEYYGYNSLEFRKHNSDINNRYAIKPAYKRGTKDRLPECPVIYLGLTRLFPFGEFQDDSAIQKIKKNLPLAYQNEIYLLYRRLTGVEINTITPQKMGNVKVRADFNSNQIGIDSNTISAGEDNLFIIITALISLKFYYECIKNTNEIESILLIDELDATLHPSIQFCLLELFRNFSVNYKIQFVFTTHSLTLIEYALSKKDNIIYLIDNATSVIKLPDPDIYKIKMYLYNITHDDIYANRVIPLFTEDSEAREFLKCLFDYYLQHKVEFKTVSCFFHKVDANIGAHNLMAMFGDRYLLDTTMKYICILDGDQQGNLNNQIITLPGDSSPEKLVMEYSKLLYQEDSEFWTDSKILNLGYGKLYYRDSILPDIDGINTKLQELMDFGKSVHGVERDLRKKVFLKHSNFFTLIMVHWINNRSNIIAVEKFYRDLYSMFKKVAEFYGINSALWIIN